MIQLTYEPALDPYHTVFRMLRLRPLVADIGSLHKDQVRILDFYHLLPFRIGEIKFMNQHRRYRALAKKYESQIPYGDLPESRSLFERMESIQTAALDTLVDQNIYSQTSWEKNEVSATDAPIPAPLLDRLREANAADAELETLLGMLAREYPLNGEGGLKHRTGLLEHRYDAV